MTHEAMVNINNINYYIYIYIFARYKSEASRSSRRAGRGTEPNFLSLTILDASKMIVSVETLKREKIRNEESFVDEESASENIDTDWMQTAYQKTFFGTLLYYCTVLTMWGFQVLLLLLTLGFYATELERYDLTPITDTKQVLFAFQLVWMVGFVWCLSLKWPSR